jgi:hypothetical protein
VSELSEHLDERRARLRLARRVDDGHERPQPAGEARRIARLRDVRQRGALAELEQLVRHHLLEDEPLGLILVDAAAAR